MISESLYRYYGEIPNYAGGSITVLPCGVVTFGGDDSADNTDPSWDQYVKFIGGHDGDLAAELAALDDSDSGEHDDPEPNITNKVINKIAEETAGETIGEALEELAEEAVDAVAKTIVVTGADEHHANSKIILVKSFCPRYYDDSDDDSGDNNYNGGDDVDSDYTLPEETRPRAADPVPLEYMFLDSDAENITNDSEFDITTL